MSQRENARRALSSFRLEGELVHKENGIGVRRGGSIFEVSQADILSVQELPGNRVIVSVKADAQLARTTLLTSKWWGSAVGYRPIFDDCSDCTECSDCSDCTECSVCSDCTECSVCAGPTECSVCLGPYDCSVCIDPTECSVSEGLGGNLPSSGGQYSRTGFGSSFVRRSRSQRDRSSRRTRRP
jgi:hypothetical protein